MTKNSFVVELTFKEGGFGKKKGARGGGGWDPNVHYEWIWLDGILLSRYLGLPWIFILKKVQSRLNHLMNFKDSRLSFCIAWFEKFLLLHQ